MSRADRAVTVARMSEILTLFAQPATWAAVLTLIVLEVVLGIANLIFVSILSTRLPE